ncbi:pyruvate/ketoisovalerate oxidoreductase, gamma subunit [Desulfurococcaceae archaeon AG1]|nr:pyruvate/ketoisovalerate oxidoreductase, gamma subunit [Desulfurococcaceae archaeon AG1]
MGRVSHLLNIGETIEIRFHGRGGQGAVTASIILAEAAGIEGLYSQAFPEFGPERRGAPVKAYTRISKEPIRTRAPISSPDVVVVLDPSLQPSIYLQGLKSKGLVIINSKRDARSIAQELGVERVVAIDATGIALRNMGVPIVNVAMLGALVRVLEYISLDSVAKAALKILFNIKWEDNLELLLKTPSIGEKILGNIRAMVEAYKSAEVLMT